jgi:cold shock CspA family protein
MTTPSLTATARLVAKLLAQRPTPQDEVANLIWKVHGALTHLDGDDGQEEEAAPTKAPTPRSARRKPRPLPAAPRAAEDRTAELAAKPPAPKLVRRAEIAAAPAVPSTPNLAAAPSGAVRGVVKWFDPRSGKGALRLQGVGDLPLEARHLAESGIARLFKGQEVEATLAGSPQAPQLQHLSLPGTVATPPLGGGMVRSRRAKTVLVELKRESMRRVAARAEAEQLLRRPR